ncbi:MAG: prepilin-type N-terminal cleavage/methylation domain-containing protein [Nitrospirae bacterium]|nr:prepilin-type N-terminal cleavage/methylation domain-containing protein [Nitrospirota bacterium]
MNKKGFTLTELLIVIARLLVSSLLLPYLSTLAKAFSTLNIFSNRLQ